MSKADVINFANIFGNDQGDANELDKNYGRVITVLALSPWNVEAELVTTLKDTNQYTLDESVGQILFVFYDNRVLSLEKIDRVKMLNSNWRDATGDPFIYIQDEEDTKVLRLFPTPDKSSADFTFLLGESFGVDYPENSIVTVHTRKKLNWAEQFDLPLAFEVLAEEFSRKSDHEDAAFAKTCREFSSLIFEVL